MWLIKYFKIRHNERLLLLLATITIAFGFYILYGAKPPENNIFIWYPSIIIAMFWIIHIILYINNPKTDEIILPAVCFFSFTGMMMIYRLNPAMAIKQFHWMIVSLIGSGAMILYMKKSHIFQKYTYLWAVIGIFLLVITIIFGTEVNGAKLWLSFGPVNLQPVEIVKYMFVLFLANYLKEHQSLLVAKSSIPGWWRLNIRYSIPMVIIWFLSLGVLVFQKDLGMALLCFGIFISMFYMATGRSDYCLLGIIIFIIGALFCYHYFSHLQVRVSCWLNPWADMEKKGYQITQGLMAISSGGLWGKGLGLGEPYWIPIVETDFIFSAIGEELGLMGSFAIIILYIIFISRGIKMSLITKNTFKKILVFGITSVFAIQTWVILGGVLKLIPLTGITLPFISYGGSSLLSNFLALGILLGFQETKI